MNSEDFSRYVDRAMQGNDLDFVRPVVEKELLHYEIFGALDEAGLLKNLVFQGGTSLRLCYGSQRFSEDLDFAGGKYFSADDLTEIKDCVESRIGKRFGLEVTVREPKKESLGVVRVDKWLVSIQTSPGRADLPRQKIKLEIANVPAYTREVLPLRINYPVLVGRHQPLVAVESMDEILADKLIALPMSISRRTDGGMEYTPARIRHRDVWDIPWLVGQGAGLNVELVKKKIVDYGLQEFPAYLDRAVTAMPTISGSNAFRTQMARFLPQSRHGQVFGDASHQDYLAKTIKGLLLDVRGGLSAEVQRQEGVPKRPKRGPEL